MFTGRVEAPFAAGNWRLRRTQTDDSRSLFDHPPSKGYNYIGKQKLKSIGVHHEYSDSMGGSRPNMLLKIRIHINPHED